MASGTVLDILHTTPLDPKARPLLDALLAEYDRRYGTFFDPRGASAELERYPAALFAPPDGAFVLLLRDGETVGGGAFMRHDESTAELKRVWVREDLRRQGLARRILTVLEAQAVRQGYSRIYLTTGFRQPEAAGLYLSSGYRALFDLDVDPEVHRKLPFEKHIGLPHPQAVAEACCPQQRH